MRLTNQINALTPHKQVTIPHRARKIHFTRLRVRNCDSFMQIVYCQQLRINVLNCASDTHREQFDGIGIADV